MAEFQGSGCSFCPHDGEGGACSNSTQAQDCPNRLSGGPDGPGEPTTAFIEDDERY